MRRRETSAPWYAPWRSTTAPEDQTRWLETQPFDPADVGTAFGLDLAMPESGEEPTPGHPKRG